jgi:hypothetical protein
MSVIGSLPVSLANNTLADATQVMANFNYIVAQVNANAVGLNQANNFTVNPTINGSQSISAGNVANSIASLRLQVKTGPGICFVNGWYQSGDGGGGTYYYDSADVVSADNGGTIIVASDGGRWKLLFTNFLSIKQFGAKVDGSTDDSAAWTAIFAALPAGGIVVVPRGTTCMNPTVFSGLSNISIVGQGRNASTIALLAAGTMMTFSNCQWMTFKDLNFQLNGLPQAIAATFGVRMDTGSGNNTFLDCNFQGFAQDGLQLVGTVGTPLSGNKVIRCYFLGNGQRQFYSTYSNDYHYLENQFGRLAGITKAVYGAYLDNSSAGTYGMNYHWNNGIGCVNNSANYATVSLNRFEESDTNGYSQNGGAYVIFTNNKVHTNSQTSTGTSDGAYFTNVTFLVLGHNLAFSFDSSRHRWDINIDSGCDNVTIGKNKLNNFAAGFGPVRISGGFVVAPAPDDSMPFTTNATVAAASTVFLGLQGAQATESATFSLSSRRATVARVYAACSTAPGVGKSFTYTLMVNGSPTSMTFSITGGATFVNAITTSNPAILLAPDDTVSVKLVTDAGAAAAYHRVKVDLVEY